MTLPPPSDKSVYWKNYEIDTPAFCLSPLEKPDMSPYLVHMTGKQAIHGILATDQAGQGKINAAVPSQTKSQWYQAAVVCFTESPLFAVDAFRYIKFDRWLQDLRYGLCFSKERLVAHGVRPVFYADSAVVAKIKALTDSVAAIPSEQHREQVSSLLSAIVPVLNSLMEYDPKQGFIWEREWRYPDPGGFAFSYEDIKIICCPDEERADIAKVLGTYAERITFVSSWDQYDDVIAFLKSREDGWKKSIALGDEDLPKLLLEYKKERSKLAAYKIYADRLQSEMALVESCAIKLDERIEELTATIEASDIEACCNCGQPFDNECSRISWNEEEEDFLCGNCYAEYRQKCDAPD